MRPVDIIVAFLLIVGGLNWRFLGASDVNLVGATFGPPTLLSSLVYLAVGASALYLAIAVPRLARLRSVNGSVRSRSERITLR